jgi:hypothetical protein
MLSVFLLTGKNFYFGGQEIFHFLPNFFFIERLSPPFFLPPWDPGPAGMNKLTGRWGSINMFLGEFTIQPTLIFRKPCLH